MHSDDDHVQRFPLRRLRLRLFSLFFLFVLFLPPPYLELNDTTVQFSDGTWSGMFVPAPIYLNKWNHVSVNDYPNEKK